MSPGAHLSMWTCRYSSCQLHRDSKRITASAFSIQNLDSGNRPTATILLCSLKQERKFGCISLISATISRRHWKKSERSCNCSVDIEEVILRRANDQQRCFHAILDFVATQGGGGAYSHICTQLVISATRSVLRTQCNRINLAQGVLMTTSCQYLSVSGHKAHQRLITTKPASGRGLSKSSIVCALHDLPSKCPSLQSVQMSQQKSHSAMCAEFWDFEVPTACLESLCAEVP